MVLKNLLDKYYLQIFNEGLSEADQYEAYKNLTGFYGPIVRELEKVYR